jgi:foldase protein PrsA
MPNPSATLIRRVTRLRRPALALGALLPVLALAACGGSGPSVPGNAVARVGDQSITKDQFQHWMQVAAISTAGQSGTKAKDVAVPDPPDYQQCVAAKKKTAPKPAKGQPATTDAQYKQQCQQEFNSLRDQVMSFLISASWIQQEAGAEGVKVTDQEVNKQLEQTKKQSFPKPADFQKFLKQSGMTESDILFRVRLDTLSNKLRDHVVKGKDAVTPAQISAYYDKNKSKFSQPEHRDIRIVLTKSEAEAKKAKQALQSGQSWAAVAKRYSTDQASKNQGGKLSDVTKGQQEKALDDAVFSASKGKLEGPLKTQFGWYVFVVDKITPGSQQSLKAATPIIKQQLASQHQQDALNTFVKGFQKEWKGKTSCRDGYVTQECENAPPPKKTSTTTTPQTTTTAP